jgi:hypothetical protein
MTEENSNRGLTNVQKARINNWESRDLKHFKISLAPWDASTLGLSTFFPNVITKGVVTIPP